MVANSGYGHAVADELSSDSMMRREPSMTRDMMNTRRDSQIRRAPNSSGLYDVLDLILDKGIVIDAFVRVSLVGIELLTVDLRVVIASVDTYLRYAEGVERLQVYDRAGSKRLGDMVGGGMKKAAIAKGASSIGKAISGKDSDDDDDNEGNDEEEGGLTGTLTRGVKNVVGRIIGGDDDEEEDEKTNDRGREQGQRRRLPGRGGREAERRAPARSGGSGASR